MSCTDDSQRPGRATDRASCRGTAEERRQTRGMSGSGGVGVGARPPEPAVRHRPRPHPHPSRFPEKEKKETRGRVVVVIALWSSSSGYLLSCQDRPIDDATRQLVSSFSHFHDVRARYTCTTHQYIMYNYLNSI